MAEYLSIRPSSQMGLGTDFDLFSRGMALAVQAPTPIWEPFYAIRVNKKWGFIDQHGTLRIEPIYDYRAEFPLMLLLCSITGSNFFKPYFFDELTAVALDNRWGYINRAGEFIIPPSYELGHHSHKGFSVVALNDKKGVINRQNEWVIQPWYEDLGCYEAGKLMRAKVDGAYGFLDTSGDFAIDPIFNNANSFHEGLAVVCEDEGYGFIDEDGDYVIDPDFEWVNNFSEGLAVFKEDEQYGYIDQSGAVIIPAQFDSADEFMDGVAVVKMDEKSGYIYPDGSYFIEPSYDTCQPFREGLAAVEINERFGYINKANEFIIEPRFDLAFPFDNGLAMITVSKYSTDDMKFGYINCGGDFIWKPVL